VGVIFGVSDLKNFVLSERGTIINHIIIIIINHEINSILTTYKLTIYFSKEGRYTTNQLYSAMLLPVPGRLRNEELAELRRLCGLEDRSGRAIFIGRYR